MKNNEKKREYKCSGFTLIEILLVVVIIGILAAVAVPRFAGRTDQAKKSATKATLNAMHKMLDMYEIDNGYYPESTDCFVDDAGICIKDAWGNPIKYEKTSTGYRLISAGPPGGSPIIAEG